MLRLKHMARLSAQVWSYSRLHRTWWMIPVMVFLGVAGLAMSAASATVPVAVYTLF